MKKKVVNFFRCFWNIVIKCSLAIAIVELLAIIAIVGGPTFFNTFGSDILRSPYEFVNKYGKEILEAPQSISNQKDSSNEISECIISNSGLNKGDDKNEYEKSAQYSYNVVNTISGIVTPFLTIIALFVAYKTFTEDKKANDESQQQQSKAINTQNEQFQISEFESHLFQMIDQQHKLEDKVIAKHGSFRELYEQFCKIYEITKSIVENNIKDDINEKVKDEPDENKKTQKKEKILKELTLRIAYYIFYFGADESFMCDKTRNRLIEDDKLKKDHVNKMIKELDRKHDTIVKGKECDLFHYQKSEQLGIYYRNLFYAIRYIDWECPGDQNKKDEYAKLVRTQISDFAQLMLYYNMQGERGSAWLKGKQEKKEKEEVKNPKDEYDCLLTRYKPIKNCAISKEFGYEIDPRNDSRKELFSKEVIRYELDL